ncbi:30S ribosomal protein S16 [Flavobacteriaceae bacterium TP-CH-4]|uniref:Small ribosomal subunit protein bS16 n=1 Tax=Pelagihabitans pacificus TaxID=2696054 RepID=A0A967ASQ8_9FLAO|nr:30S ribosomal protein S16 [Pelagihabitans pacificus]
MPVKIRLQRHGKKGKPFYWIVAADSRAKRDGKFLEKLGTYDPNTNPATIDLNLDHSLEWLQNGAQPTNTARAILSYKGVLMKMHLLGGVKKGAFTEEQAEKKFQAWLEEKEGRIQAKVGNLDKAKADARAAALKAEKEANEKRALAAAEAELPDTPEGEDAAAEVEAVAEAPAPEAEVAQSEETAPVVEEVVETPEVPQPDKENADHTPVAPVVEEEVVAANEDMKKAPSVEEVMEASDEEVQPAPTAEEASSEEE